MPIGRVCAVQEEARLGRGEIKLIQYRSAEPVEIRLSRSL